MKPTKFVFSSALLSLLLWSSASSTLAQRSYLYGVQPGDADISFRDNAIIVKNGMLTVTWSIAKETLRGLSFADHATPKPIRLPQNAFTLVLASGKTVGASSMRISEPARLENLEIAEQSARLEDHFTGKRALVRLQDPNSKISVLWSAEVREGDNYIRQQIEVSSPSDVAIREVRLCDFNLPGAKLVGTVSGSPVTAGNVFLGFEHPLSHCVVKGTHVLCWIDRKLPLKAGQTIRYSSVMGVSPPGQMRRGFLNYVERERAHPYRPFLHYNSWFDIGFGKPYDQTAALDAIQGIGEELHVKRGVKLDSFLFDDGWDDPRSLWSFNSGFPDGFTPIKSAAAQYGAAPGIWLSPWGGYAEAKEERLKYGAQQSFEMNQGGFALSGPKYFSRFHDVTIEFILKYGINQFKIDGTGNVNSVFAGSQLDSDFHAAISLIEEWRAVKPDIFVNLTTGTYPSPFWLRYADSIWRGGEDDDFTGVGLWREKWITYRDAATYAGVVQKGPLFPLNSLMLHGIIYARQAEHLNDDPAHAFTHEVQDYFGSGTQLQEMYITHSLLTDADWDVLAEAANWSRENAATLADTHWIGGDPGKLQVYGWAAWSPEKGIITLRNPSDHPQAISIDVGHAFEPPAGAARKYRAHSPWNRDRQTGALDLVAGQSHTFSLQPFEVLTLEAIPTQ